MENASKALLIAAAVLIAILIITVGIKIFTSTSGTQKAAAEAGKTISTKTGQAADLATSAITGKEKYVDPFDYGKYTKETIPVGADITLDTEKFRVFYHENGVIKAMPHYNLVETTNGMIKQGPAVSEITTEISTPFSSTNYWSQTIGWNDNPIDSSVNINMTEKDNHGNYKNNIQQYIEVYKETLEDMGAKGIIVRVCTKPELDSQLGSVIQKKDIINPSKKGIFWLGSVNTGASTNDFIWAGWIGGSISHVQFYDSVRSSTNYRNPLTCKNVTLTHSYGNAKSVKNFYKKVLTNSIFRMYNNYIV